MTKEWLKEPWHWYAGDNDEYYTVGPCETKEQVIQEATIMELGYDYDNKDEHVLGFNIIQARKNVVKLSDLDRDWETV